MTPPHAATATAPTIRTTKRKAALPALPPEPWGWKLKRAREQYAGMTLDDAVAQLSRYIIVHPTTINRLERLDTPPVGRAAKRHRQMAYVLAMIYGLDPEQFGLLDEDVPEGMLAALHADLGPGPRGGGGSRMKAAPGIRQRVQGNRGFIRLGERAA